MHVSNSLCLLVLPYINQSPSPPSPRGHQREADRARQRFATWDGDHATLLSVMRAYLATPIAERHRWCRDCYVSARAVAKAHDVFEQLMRLMGGDAGEWVGVLERN